MASSMAIRRAAATTSAIFNRLVGPVRTAATAPSVFRSFNTNAQMTAYEDDDRDVDIGRRSGRSGSSVSSRRDAFPGFFSDSFGPFSPPRSVSQLLNVMDQFMENPLAVPFGGLGTASAPRRGWDVREDDNAIYIRMDMPGLDKDDVKVRVEENTLVIKGEAAAEEGAKAEDGEEYGRRRYSTRLDITPNLYKLDAIKAEMKNGVLKVAVPKVKPEERKDVFQVNVE